MQVIEWAFGLRENRSKFVHSLWGHIDRRIFMDFLLKWEITIPAGKRTPVSNDFKFCGNQSRIRKNNIDCSQLTMFRLKSRLTTVIRWYLKINIHYRTPDIRYFWIFQPFESAFLCVFLVSVHSYDKRSPRSGTLSSWVLEICVYSYLDIYCVFIKKYSSYWHRW